MSAPLTDAEVLGEGVNAVHADTDPTAHAQITAARASRSTATAPGSPPSDS